MDCSSKAIRQVDLMTCNLVLTFPIIHSLTTDRCSEWRTTLKAIPQA